MIYELKPTEYDKARPLFQAMDYHLALNAIFEGTVCTKVYVDDPSHPQAALTSSKHRFYLAGAQGNAAFNAAVRRHFTETIYPRTLAAGDEMFVLYYAPDRWEHTLDEVFRDKFPVKLQRQFYVFKELKHDWRTLLPEGFTLRFVDRELLANKHLKHLDDLREEMCSERASVEDFLDKSFGVCVVHDEEIIGWCLSEYNSADRCEVGIETLDGYQRRGFATIMASALIEYARSRGVVQIGWHSYARNTASVATALKVGFEKARDYPVYFAYFDEIDNLAVHGSVCFRQQQYAEAMAWYERAFARGEAKAWAYWGAACASALLGQRDAAFRYLNQAVDKGFLYLEYIKNTAHLRSLHATQEWQALVERVERSNVS